MAQSCPTHCDPTDYTVHGILQARILEWVAFPFSRGSSKPRNQTQVSRITGGFFTCWATRGKFIALKSYLRKSRKISNGLNLHLKQLQKEEQSLKLVLIEGWGFPCGELNELELNEFGEVAGYKTDSEKSLAFAATLMNLDIIILSQSNR